MAFIVNYKNMQTINTYRTAEDACLAVAKRLSELAKIGGTVALSGGETPKKLFRIIAEQFSHTNWSRIKFFWGDERMVAHENAESNYGAFYHKLVSTKIIDQQNTFPITYFANEAQSLENYLSKIEKNVPYHNGIPQFDVVILGIGEDGHVASIFPDNLASFTSMSFAEIATHPNSKQQRISLTGRTINNSKTVFFLTTGENKSTIINEIITHKNRELPATLVDKPSQIVWFMDEGAASKLKTI